MAVESSENVGVALGLVCGAGLATGLGAAVVFFPSLVKLASKRVLAASLGFSSGVMVYVSFIEIFQKSSLSFEDAGHDEDKAYVYATLCFFGGVLVMTVLNFLVTRLLGGQHHHHHDDNDDHHKGTHQQKNVVEVSNQKIIKHKLSVHEEDTNCPCCSTDPAGQLDRLHTMAEELEAEQETNNTQTQNTASEEYQDNADECGHPVHESNQSKESSTSPDDQATNNLRLMGLKTALAIGLHNFPEGLATFVAALSDPKVGAVLAVAIAIHNIPEGLCVALPIYYATGNRLKGFLWALLSGASEFVAALLGWAVLANSFSDDLYAVLFGLVSGMMVTISVRELLPTAHFYDPDDSVVTYSFIAGMILMALSLVLFVL